MTLHQPDTRETERPEKARRACPRRIATMDQYAVAELLGISGERLRFLAENNSIPPPQLIDRFPYWDERRLKASTPIWKQGTIYFVSCGDFIKIGFAEAVKQRLRNLQSSSPFELKLLHSMRGTLAREGELLAAFADIRQRGEWFKAEPPLVSFIERVKKRGDRYWQKIRQ